MRLRKESLSNLVESSAFCGPVRKKSNQYVPGITGLAYNSFRKEVVYDHCFDYGQAVMLRLSASKILTKENLAIKQVKQGVVERLCPQ